MSSNEGRLLVLIGGGGSIGEAISSLLTPNTYFLGELFVLTKVFMIVVGVAAIALSSRLVGKGGLLGVVLGAILTPFSPWPGILILLGGAAGYFASKREGC